MEKTYTVYKHTTPSNKVYIGITSKPVNARWRNGLGYKKQPYFYKAIQKYGWENIKHEIIAKWLTKDEACKMEIHLISEYESTNRDNGYNSSTGGELTGEGHAVSEETRKKISNVLKGHAVSEDVRKKVGDSTRNRIVSEKTKEKMRASQKERFSHKEEIEKLRKSHEYISKETREKLSTARKKYLSNENVRKKLSESMKGKNNPWYGKHLSEETREKMRNAKPKKKVVCFETGIIYNSIMEAERKTGIANQCIIAVCKHKRKTAGGYHWKYVEGEEHAD